MALLAASGNEARMVHAVIDGAVRGVLAGLRRQQMHDVEFGHGQIDYPVTHLAVLHQACLAPIVVLCDAMMAVLPRPVALE